MIKLLLFVSFFFLLAFVTYRGYQFFNQKIQGSNGGWQLLFYTFSMIMFNLFIFYGGLLLFLSAYNYLAS